MLSYQWACIQQQQEHSDIIGEKMDLSFDQRAAVCFFFFPVTFEQAEQVCPTYRGQQSFIYAPLTSHHKSLPLAGLQYNTTIDPPPVSWAIILPVCLGSSINCPSFCLLRRYAGTPFSIHSKTALAVAQRRLFTSHLVLLCQSVINTSKEYNGA